MLSFSFCNNIICLTFTELILIEVVVTFSRIRNLETNVMTITYLADLFIMSEPMSLIY